MTIGVITILLSERHGHDVYNCGTTYTTAVQRVQPRYNVYNADRTWSGPNDGINRDIRSPRSDRCPPIGRIALNSNRVDPETRPTDFRLYSLAAPAQIFARKLHHDRQTPRSRSRYTAVTTIRVYGGVYNVYPIQ